MRPWVNSDVARLASIIFWWSGDPPSRGPLVGWGMSRSWSQDAFPAGPGGPAGGRTSELLGLGVVLAVVVRHPVAAEAAVGAEGLEALGRVVRRRRGRVEPGRAVLEREAQASELHLDLVDGLRAEVANVQEVGLGASDQLANGVDALAL